MRSISEPVKINKISVDIVTRKKTSSPIIQAEGTKKAVPKKKKFEFLTPIKEQSVNSKLMKPLKK